MKRGILLAAAAALLAAGLANAEGEENGNGGRRFAATARFEQIWPAAGFDYTFAKRVSIGPVVKYDGGKFVAAAESRVYIRADHSKAGFQPYFLAEAGWQTGSDPPGPTPRGWYWGYWYWGYSSRDGADAADDDDAPFPYRYYAFAGPGLDLRAKGVNFVPFIEMGPRQEFREGNEGTYLYWALGLRYTW